MSRSPKIVFAAPPDALPAVEPVCAHRYFVYGMTLQSEFSLALPEEGYGGLGQIELRIAPASCFSVAARKLAGRPDSDSFCQSILLRDGSTAYIGKASVNF
jgi:hypothetical protein